MMPDDECAVRQGTGQVGTFAEHDADAVTSAGTARPVVGRWAVSWAGTVVVTMAWLVSLSGGEGGLLSALVLVLFVVLYTTIPALVGLLVLLVPALFGRACAVRDGAVVVVATAVGGVAGAVLELSIRTGAVAALLGSVFAIGVLRARTALVRWSVVVITLGVILGLGRFVPIF